MTLVNLSLRPDALTKLEQRRTNYNRHLCELRKSAEFKWFRKHSIAWFKAVNWFEPTKFTGIYKIANSNPHLSLMREGGYYNQICVDDMVGYCVADNEQQVKDWFESFKDRYDGHYIIAMTPVYKNAQPERDGWRWEKNGEYIGTQNSQADYLYDEPEIEMVYMVNLIEVK